MSVKISREGRCVIVVAGERKVAVFYDTTADAVWVEAGLLFDQSAAEKWLAGGTPPKGGCV